jgi:hypothetical protein
MKVLEADSIILGTIKLWRIFPIKQKFSITVAFFHSKSVQNLSKLVMFLTVFSTYFHTENIVRNITNFDQNEQFELSKKATVVSNFSLIGRILHNFLVPKMIELACKIFMPIQTLDLHRVTCFIEKNDDFLQLHTWFHAQLLNKKS